VWKVGFSGEVDPRAVFWSTDDGDIDTNMWDLDLDDMGVVDRREAARLVGVRITRRLRESFSKSAPN
jgi:actin-related protein 10